MNFVEAKEKLGVKTFREGQENVVTSLIAGIDTVAILPTGYGKSVCFQIPALTIKGITIVFTPLIALMNDQVDNLHRKGISAYLWNSDTSRAEEKEIKQAIWNQATKFLYIAPEKLLNDEFVDFIRQYLVGMIVVDEAHGIFNCEDFRSAYKRIARFRDRLPNRPVIAAMTATASDEVMAAMIKGYGLRNPAQYVINPDRPNLSYHMISGKDPEVILAERLRTQFRKRQMLVFCGRVKKAEIVAAKLQKLGYRADFYHAAMSKHEKRVKLDKFVEKKIIIMCCTSAFGMGIDVPAISIVLHKSVPLSLDDYCQEAGRGGRDGESCECYIEDVKRYGLQEHFIDSKNPEISELRKVFEALRNFPNQKIMISAKELADLADVEAAKIPAIKSLLRSHGHINYWRNGARNFFVQITGMPRDKQKVKRKLLQHIVRTGRDYESGEIEHNMKQLTQAMGMTETSVMTHLNALKKAGVIQYNAPYTGSVIVVTRNNFSIRAEDIEDKGEKDWERFAKMQEFMETPDEKKREYILNYFGWDNYYQTAINF